MGPSLREALRAVKIHPAQPTGGREMRARRMVARLWLESASSTYRA